jgi:hypothetical protein
MLVEFASIPIQVVAKPVSRVTGIGVAGRAETAARVAVNMVRSGKLGRELVVYVGVVPEAVNKMTRPLY